MNKKHSIINIFSDIVTLTWRNILHYTRVPQLIVFSTIQPVMFMLLFTYVFGGAIKTQVSDYIIFLLPGIIVQTALFGSMQTGVGLAQDMTKGIIDRFRSLPIAQGAILAGRTITDVIRNIFTIFIMIGIGYLIGFRIEHSILAFIFGLLVILLFGFAFSWISATIGLAVRNVETAQVAGFIWIFPLVFASSIFVPINTMPAWLQAFASHTPITYTVNAFRALLLGEPYQTPLTYSLFWSFILLAIFIPLSVRLFKKQ